MRPMGICFTPEDDEKLARGWPYLIVPVDGRKEDKTTAAAENAWMRDPFFFTEWPRLTLHRFLRIFFALPEWKNGKVAQDVFKHDAPLEAAECLEGLRNRVREPPPKQPFEYRNLVWGVEAIAGTDATLEEIVSEMETTYPTLPEHASVFEAVVTAAAFLLLRATPRVANKARERMERLYAAPRDPQTLADFEGYFGAIDYALHGAAGTKRFLANWPKWTVWLEVPALYCAGSLDYAVDDPAFVRQVLKTTSPKTLSNGMSVRVAAFGGPEALALLPTRKWPAVQMPSVARDLGMIRAPEIVTFMASLVGKSSVKDVPITWLQAHADYARPILAKTKTDAAKRVLRQLVETA